MVAHSQVDEPRLHDFPAAPVHHRPGAHLHEEIEHLTSDIEAPELSPEPKPVGLDRVAQAALERRPAT